MIRWVSLSCMWSLVLFLESISWLSPANDSIQLDPLRYTAHFDRSKVHRGHAWAMSVGFCHFLCH